MTDKTAFTEKPNQSVETAELNAVESKTVRAFEKGKISYREIFEAVNDAIFIHDMTDGKILDVNRRTLEMYGYTKAEILSLKIEDLSLGEPPYGKAEAEKNIQRAGTGVPHLFDWLAKKKNGELFWVEVNLNIVTINDQKVVIAIVRDINERKTTEAALRFTQYAIDRTMDQAFWLSEDGRFFYVNDAACRTLEYSREELMALSLSDIVPGVTPQEFKQYWHDIQQKGSITFESMHLSKNGRTYPVEIRATHVNFDGKDYSCIFATDISERKKMEQSLRESEGFLRTLLQTIPDLIWAKDPNGVFLTCNETFEQFYGAKEKEIVGKTDYDFVDEAQANFFREHDHKAAVAGKPTVNEEWVTFASNGKNVLLETIKTPMLDDQGNLLGVLGVARDITERTRAEEEKDRLSGQLQQAQKMEAVGRLAGGVAHDFNNMLSVIIGFCDIAMDDAELSGTVLNALQEIMKAARRSVDVTRQLLVFARKQTISPEVVQLNDTIEELVRMIQRLIGEDLDLVWAPGKDVWKVKIDPSQINQIIINLCVNARDAMKDGGRITIETGNIEFDNEYCTHHLGCQVGEYVFMTVSDTGTGMDAETIEKIFDPFFTTKEAGQGTGLGLATVHGIVNQNNGFINVYSEPNRGTIFKIYLPRYADKNDRQAEKEQTIPYLGGSETILVVEDEVAILTMSTMMLESLGYHVLTARKPRDAIHLVEKYKGTLHLLLTDVVMPEMNGRVLADRILSMQPGMATLFMSGYTANIIAHHGILSEGVSLVHKPFSKKELGARVREVLDKGKP